MGDGMNGLFLIGCLWNENLWVEQLYFKSSKYSVETFNKWFIVYTLKYCWQICLVVQLSMMNSYRGNIKFKWKDGLKTKNCVINRLLNVYLLPMSMGPGVICYQLMVLEINSLIQPVITQVQQALLTHNI